MHSCSLHVLKARNTAMSLRCLCLRTHYFCIVYRHSAVQNSLSRSRSNSAESLSVCSLDRGFIRDKNRQRSVSRSSLCQENLQIKLRYPSFAVVKAFHTSCPTAHTSSSSKHRNCWNCGRDTNPERELFFCDCGVVQKPAAELTYFELLQLKPSFDIDTKQLGDIMRETQKRLHPDKFSTKSKEEQDFAQEQSSLLNKAYDTLLKPLSRAIYLLKQQNLEISEHDNFSDPEFLMEVMEISEEISQAKTAEDVKEIERKNDERIAETVKMISELCQKQMFKDMKNATIKLRYFITIQERINEVKQSSLG